MTRIIIIALLISCVSPYLFAQQLNTPLLVRGRVYNSTGQTIATEDLRFRVFLAKEPGVYLDQDDLSCGYEPPLWYAELGNLQTSWEYGEQLIILIENIKERENVRYSWIIDSSAHVPDIQTQPLYQNDLITQFRLSDKGVFHNQPVQFIFRSVFTTLPKVELKIFSHNGQEVFKSAEAQPLDLEYYQFSWDGKTDQGQKLISGLYNYYFIVNGKPFHSGIITLKNE
jgi:FlgD Ig-like domain